MIFIVMDNALSPHQKNPGRGNLVGLVLSIEKLRKSYIYRHVLKMAFQVSKPSHN